MKTKDLQAAIAANGGSPVEVYWSPEQWEFKRNQEDPNHCRYTTDGALYGKAPHSSWAYQAAGGRVRATHLKLVRGVGSRLSVHFVPLAQVVGLYADVADERRRVIAEVEMQRRARQDARTAHVERVTGLVERCKALGFQAHTEGYGETLKVFIPVDELARLLDILDTRKD